MGSNKREELQSSDIAAIIIMIIILGILADIAFYAIFIYQPPCTGNKFIIFLKATKTSNGWIIKGYGWIEKYNQNTGKYEKDYRVELSKLYYKVFNVSNNDYLFIPQRNNSDRNYPHTGNTVAFSYVGCGNVECANCTWVKLP